MYYIGIDTSCYTTSVSAVDMNCGIVYDGRIVLKVMEGSRGLRQSDAVFQHNANLAKLIEQLFEIISGKDIIGIAVSTKPRNIEGSYMPVFTAGHYAARILSSSLKIPLKETTHQQGHIAAGQWSSNTYFTDKYLVYHISGGTTELLLVEDDNMECISIVGGSRDLNAGQFIDRVGVSMGISFPCGQHMDNLCKKQTASAMEFPISVDGCFLSFSGPESHVQRILKNKACVDAELSASISAGVFQCIGRSLEKTMISAANSYGVKNVMIVGGVAANSIIREILYKGSSKKEDINIIFSDPVYSSDNAVGTAVIGMRSRRSK
ncbi:MAG: O-sialoglycoprotein endopeptidase [Bacillota bacterium]